MNEMQLLTWVRGPGLNLAVGIFVLGVLWRLFEIYSLGRKKDLSAPRALPGASGWRTIFRRTLPAEGMLKIWCCAPSTTSDTGFAEPLARSISSRADSAA